MAGSACAIAEAVGALVRVHSRPSWAGLMYSLAGFALPIFAIAVEIGSFWWKVFTFWKRKWKGDWAWYRDSRLFVVIQFFVSIIVVVALFAFITSFRRFQVIMVNPVYAFPSGRLGQWITVPVAVVLMNSWHGTVVRSPLRLFSVCFGAIIGVPALEFARWGRSGGIQSMAVNLSATTPAEYYPYRLFWGNFAAICYLALVVFFCVFSSVDTTGRLAMYGAFHNQYGYGPFMIAYFSIVICTEGVDLTQNLFQGSGQPAPYTTWDYVFIRIIGQCTAVVVCVLVASLLPVRAGTAARKVSAQCLKLQARALLTSIQNWRGDIISEEAEGEALRDLEWCHHGRQRVNHFILEMDGLGRLRYLVGDHFFTFWSGDISDLCALRTLHCDMTMFINQFMKGCRAPVGHIPTSLEALATAVDIWAVACAKRCVYVANRQHRKMEGLKLPTDEALEAVSAFKAALPALIIMVL
jgi:hypothetical protein